MIAQLEARATGPLVNRLLSNTAFTFLGKAAGYAGGLFLTPIVFHVLGSETFGLWALILLLSGQFGLVDLGFGAALTKHVAEFNASNTLQRINQPFTVAVLFYVTTSAVLAGVLWTHAEMILRFFSVPSTLWDQARVLLPLTALVFLLSSVVGVLQSLINGLQRMEITNAIAVLQVISMIVLTLFFLSLGRGLAGVVIGLLCSLALVVGGLALFAKRLLPSLRFELPRRRRGGSHIYRFGATVQVARISGIVAAYSDRVLIGHFLSLETLAKYQLGYTVIALLRGMALIFGPAIVPAASELAERGDSGRLAKLYSRGSKYSLAVGIGVGGIILALAPLITRAWLGHEDEQVVQVIRLLGLGHTFHILTGLGTSICEGIGKAGVEARFGAGLAVLQICLGLIGVMALGLTGLLAGTTLAMTVASALFLRRFHIMMTRSGALQEAVPGRRILLSGLVAAGAGLFSSQLPTSHLLPTWTPGWFSLVACTGIFVAAYATMLLSTGCVDDTDRRLVSRLLPNRSTSISRASEQEI
ncbi:MAG: oligosaccharide flippase family protein [Candidatus Eisenbacteria bacterium]